MILLSQNQWVWSLPAAASTAPGPNGSSEDLCQLWICVPNATADMGQATAPWSQEEIALFVFCADGREGSHSKNAWAQNVIITRDPMLAFGDLYKSTEWME